ncbi:Metallo-dependent phosphatase-like protein [Rhodocollybia butyracea]|uniref:Metallo-dependent phosphatase-like protein n=1 Tax=Rhodocollybia butyracea TaxID=206335 RepID=A0A9P5PPN8_9AGAR|nr:Metallo-dependent phosphatase-like protein [Rhodocollybia butyracea]
MLNLYRKYSPFRRQKRSNSEATSPPPPLPISTTDNDFDFDFGSENNSEVYGNETLTSSDNKEVVYVEYDDPLALPPTSPSYTRFVCISDTHTRSFPVPDGDVLLHSGDLTDTGTVEEFDMTMEWIRKLPHKVKIIIAGNHDLPLHTKWFKKNHYRWRDKDHSLKNELAQILKLLKGPAARAANVIYLQNEKYSFKVKGNGRTWSVYGSPWTPAFFSGGAFGYTPREAPALISKFPKTDILLTHGPPHKILDRTTRGDTPGCPSLTSALESARLRPRLHVFGHIHEAHGAYIHEWARGDVVGNIQNAPDEPETEPSEANGGQHAPTAATVFANAAAWPMGLRRSNYQRRSWGAASNHVFGGAGFRPVVVDLMD